MGGREGGPSWLSVGSFALPLCGAFNSAACKRSLTVKKCH
jgi:hypothetical protein